MSVMQIWHMWMRMFHPGMAVEMTVPPWNIFLMVLMVSIMGMGVRVKLFLVFM